jgi:protease-4
MPDSPLTAQLAKWRQRLTAPLILELDLTEGLSETRPADPVSAVLGRNRPVLPDVLDGLRRAKDDGRVSVLLARLGGKPIGLAAVQELRRAITDLAEAGKTTIAWAESFGEFSAGNIQYYLATAFDNIWLQPSGDLGLTGIAVERVFLRGALDKLGADFQVAKRQEFKSAAEQFTETGFSPAARQATDRMTASVTEQLVQAISERRGLTRERVSELVDAGPFLAAQGLAEGLVDHLGYRDEVYAEARKLAGPEASLLYLGRYQRGKVLAERARATITKTPAGPCARPDPPRPPRPRPGGRRRDGLRHDRRSHPRRGEGRPGPRHPAAGE